MPFPCRGRHFLSYRLTLAPTHTTRPHFLPKIIIQKARMVKNF